MLVRAPSDWVHTTVALPLASTPICGMRAGFGSLSAADRPSDPDPDSGIQVERISGSACASKRTRSSACERSTARLSLSAACSSARLA
jgi:hypothetical protein